MASGGCWPSCGVVAENMGFGGPLVWVPVLLSLPEWLPRVRRSGVDLMALVYHSWLFRAHLWASPPGPSWDSCPVKVGGERWGGRACRGWSTREQPLCFLKASWQVQSIGELQRAFLQSTALVRVCSGSGTESIDCSTEVWACLM